MGHPLCPPPGATLRGRLGTAAGLLLLCSPSPGQEVKPRATLLGHKDRVMCVAVSPTAGRSPPGGGDLAIPLWDAASGKGRHAVKVAGETEWLSSLAFSPDGKSLAMGGSGSGANAVEVWDVGTRKGVTVLTEGQCVAPAAAFSPDGKTLATATWGEATVKLRGVATCEQRAAVEGGRGGRVVHRLQPGRPDAGVGGEDGAIRLAAVATGKRVATLARHDSEARCLAFGPDGKLLASGGENGAVRVWDVPPQK